MRHTYREVDSCGVRVALQLLVGKWTPIILFHLIRGPLRFTELWREIPRVSKKVLVGQLRHLEDAGLVARTVHNGFPPEVSYEFTPQRGCADSDYAQPRPVGHGLRGRGRTHFLS